MGALAANLAVAAGILLAGISLTLFIVGLVAYFRVKHPRLLWVSIAFLGFLAQGVYVAVDAYQRRGELSQSWDALPALGLVNLGIVLALYVAVLRD